MRFLILCLLAVPAVFGASAAQTATPKGPTQAAAAPAARAMDTVVVHAIYLDGDFEGATQILEKALKSPHLTHGDSTFIFKHLGVIYAARDETREKGKYYMYKLVAAEPLTNILDMYASDMIYMIFKNVKDEFEANRQRLQRSQKYMQGTGLETPADSTGADPKRPVAKQAKHGHAGYYWFGGTVLVAAAAGVGVLLYYHQDEKPVVTKKTYGLD